jgi:hypothetical protein
VRYWFSRFSKFSGQSKRACTCWDSIVTLTSGITISQIKNKAFNW